MRVKKRIMAGFSLCVLTVSLGFADVFVWDGGGANDNWSTADNWTDGIPVSASNTTVRMAGNTRLSPSQDIASPFTLNRLDYVRFESSVNDTAMSPGGGPLRFVPDGVAQPRLWLDRWADCNLYNNIEIPEGVTLLADIGTWGLNLRGLISGGGCIDKQQGAGAIRLYHADNTFSGGLIVRALNSSWYQVQANASGAMGTGPVSLYGGAISTNIADAGGLILNNTATHTNTILLFAHSPIHGNGMVTLAGPLALGGYTLHLRGTGTTTASGVIDGSGAQALVKNDTGRWILAATNTFTGRLTVNNGVLGFNVPDALAPGVPLTLTGGTLELNGKSQTLGELASAPGIKPARIETSAAAALTVAQEADTAFDGCLAGPLALVKTGTGTLTLGCATNSFAGVPVVSNGTLAVAASGALGASGDLILDGGKLGLAVPATVRRLFYGVVQQPRGTYGSTASGAQFKDDARFAGTDVLTVTDSPPAAFTTHVWDAGAGAADTALALDANWEGDAAPPFDGTALAVFGTAGATATVATAASLYGASFARETDFSLVGPAALTLGQGGLSAANRTSGRSYTLTAPLLMADSHMWDIGSNVTVQASGTIGDTPGLPPVLVKTGAGRIQLNADNTFAGSLTVSNGSVRVTKAGALGSIAGATTVLGNLGGKLLLSGNFTLDEPLILGGDLNNFGLMQLESGNVTLAGPVTMTSQIRVQAGGGRTLNFTGGLTGNGSGLLVVNPGGGTIAFSAKPVIIPGQMLYFDQSGACVVAATNNVWNEALVCGGTLRCDLPNVLPPASALKIGIAYSPNATLDLNGNDQTAGRLYMGTFAAGQRVIQSASPATLTVNQNANDTLDLRFAGAVSLLKGGTGTLTLTNAFTSTSGSFSVTNGTLAVANEGTFGTNSTNIVVIGTGTLALSNSVAIADSATVTMPEAGVATAKIRLAAGVNEKVGWLYYGGKMMRAGTYGATGSGAAQIDNTHFAGFGVLTVRRDKSGTMMKLR